VREIKEVNVPSVPALFRIRIIVPALFVPALFPSVPALFPSVPALFPHYCPTLHLRTLQSRRKGGPARQGAQDSCLAQEERTSRHFHFALVLLVESRACGEFTLRAGY